MADTSPNTLTLTGTGPDRDRFVAEVADVLTHGFFGAHAPLGPREEATSRWGTDGLYEWSLRVHDDELTEYGLTTPCPPDRWFEVVVAQFPMLRWELHTSQNLIGRTLVAEAGEVNPALTRWHDYDHPAGYWDWVDELPPAEEILADDAWGGQGAIEND